MIGVSEIKLVTCMTSIRAQCSPSFPFAWLVFLEAFPRAQVVMTLMPYLASFAFLQVASCRCCSSSAT
jgi:hypothetical protein